MPKGPKEVAMPRSCRGTGRPRAALRDAIIQAAGDLQPPHPPSSWTHPVHRPSLGGHHAAPRSGVTWAGDL